MACRVGRVDYELPARGDNFDPPLAGAVVSLLASAGGGGVGGGGGGEHEMSLRPSDCADFLVPRRKVMQVKHRGFFWRCVFEMRGGGGGRKRRTAVIAFTL